MEPAIRIVGREVGLPVGKLAALPVGKHKASAARRQAIAARIGKLDALPLGERILPVGKLHALPAGQGNSAAARRLASRTANRSAAHRPACKLHCPWASAFNQRASAASADTLQNAIYIYSTFTYIYTIYIYIYYLYIYILSIYIYIYVYLYIYIYIVIYIYPRNISLRVFVSIPYSLASSGAAISVGAAALLRQKYSCGHSWVKLLNDSKRWIPNLLLFWKLLV